MAIAIQVLNHGDASFLADTGNQPFAPTRHNHIDKLAHGNQFAHRRAVGGFNHLHRTFGQARCDKTFFDARSNGLIAANGFAAATQDGGVA